MYAFSTLVYCGILMLSKCSHTFVLNIRNLVINKIQKRANSNQGKQLIICSYLTMNKNVKSTTQNYELKPI